MNTSDLMKRNLGEMDCFRLSANYSLKTRIKRRERLWKLRKREQWFKKFLKKFCFHMQRNFLSKKASEKSALSLSGENVLVEVLTKSLFFSPKML